MAQVAAAGAAGTLGRFKYNLFELAAASGVDGIQPRHRASIHRSRAFAERRLGRTLESQRSMHRAIEIASELSASTATASVYSAAGKLAVEDSEFSKATSYFKTAYAQYQELGLKIDCARVMLGMSSAYADAGNLRAARLSVSSAQKLIADEPESLPHAFVFVRLAEIELAGDHLDRAIDMYKEASAIAHRLNDKYTRFSIDVDLLRTARLAGNELTSRVVEKRLVRQSAWVPSDIEQYRKFQEIRSDF